MNDLIMFFSAILISVGISIKLTVSMMLRVYEDDLNTQQIYKMKTILYGAVIKSLLEGKNKRELLKMLNDTEKAIEEESS